VALDFRLHRAQDLPALQRLWEENTGWGTLTAELWKQHVEEGPLGGTAIVVAEERKTGKIVGEFAFTPTLAHVDGQELRGLRPGAPIVAKDYRFFGVNPFEHPAIKMYTAGLELLRDAGNALIHMVPDPRWVRLLKVFKGLATGFYPLWSRTLPLEEPLPLPPGHRVRPVELADPRIDRLWSCFSKLHRCSLVRDSRSLPWKLGRFGDTVQGVERGDELVALVASRSKGDRQWLVTDLMFNDGEDSLSAALAAAANLGDSRRLEFDETRPLRKVGVLATPVMLSAVRELGFERDDYDFPLAVHVLDPGLTPSTVDPGAWFITPSD
jgi:hypothetical protein